MSFQLKTLPFGTTLTRQIARQHLTRFNNVYWVAERGHKQIRAAFQNIRFPNPAPGVHGVFPDAPTWEKAADEHHAWVRQHILVSAAALLEVYVKAASVAAVTSKPELIDKTYMGQDGFSFIKHNTMPRPLRDLIDNVTAGFINGLWTDRFRRISRVFGALPPAVVNLAPALQTVQTKRNRIAHEFGTDGKGRRAPWDAFNILQVGPKDIDTAIKSVSDAIRHLDDKVFGPIIGGHEVLQQYHIWKAQEPHFHKYYVAGDLPTKFRNYIGSKFGSSLGADYVKGMIKYYDQI